MEVTKTIEMEGICEANEQISEAYKDLKSEFETVGMKEGQDFKIDSNGRWTDFDKDNKEVYYLFEVQMNERAKDEGIRQGWFDK